MRYLVGLVCVLALGVMGCSETSGTGGSGGGFGGEGGSAGVGGGGAGGKAGSGGMTGQVFPCTEQGIRDAIAEGGGPHTFACEGPQTVVTEAEIVVENDVTLDGGGDLTVHGNDDHFVFTVPQGVTAELRGFGVSRAGCPPEEASGKQALPPGCKANGITNGGTLTLRDSTVSDNAAFGIYNGDGASITVLNTTVSGNDEGGHGIDNDGLALVINSTISGNDVFNDGSLTLLSSTLSNDQGEYALGTGASAPTTVVANTLVRGDCENNRPLTSDGYNIESPGNACGFGQESDQVEATAEELNLGPLQDNGGPTETHALLQGSIAIDQIPEADCEADTDQRGEPRPAGAADRLYCDKGAFEWQPLNDFCKPFTNYQPACYPVCEDYAESSLLHGCVDVSSVANCYEGNDCTTDTCEAEWAAWLDDCIGGP